MSLASPFAGSLSLVPCPLVPRSWFLFPGACFLLFSQPNIASRAANITGV